MQAQEGPGGLAGWGLDVMDVLGAPGAGLLIAAENLFPPLPSEVFLPLAGFAAGQGRMALWSALVFTTAGSVIGALALYWLGRRLGAERLRGLAKRLPLFEESDVDRADAFFDRHGGKAVLFGRMLPVFRSLISIPAGVNRMPVWRFTLLTTVGSAVWNSLFVVAGFLLGENWSLIEPYSAAFEYGVLGIAAAAVVWFTVQRLRRRR